jgi:hypothetical protein
MLQAGHQWFTPVILATQVTEIRRITVQSQQIVLQDPISEKILHKSRAGGVAQVVGSEFKPQYHKKNKNHVTIASFSKVLKFCV